MYMEYITNRIRRIHKFTRLYTANPNDVVKHNRDRFFPTLELYSGLNNLIVLDFDGVVTSKSFRHLYDLCIKRCETVICSANPTIQESYFTSRGMSLPNKIYSMKGKRAKLRQLIELSKRYDNIFYIDNEEMYLKLVWVFGIKTFKYEHGKIINFSLNSK